MEDLLTKIKYAFAHQAIVEGLQIKKEHVDRLAEIAVRLCNEHSANTPVMPALQHSDDMCFHECPNCNCRCNCSKQPCSCCNEAQR